MATHCILFVACCVSVVWIWRTNGMYLRALPWFSQMDMMRSTVLAKRNKNNIFIKKNLHKPNSIITLIYILCLKYTYASHALVLNVTSARHINNIGVFFCSRLTLYEIIHSQSAKHVVDIWVKTFFMHQGSLLS